MDPRLLERIPDGGAALWDVFCAVSTGDTALRMSELESWQRMHRVELTGWEVDTLVDMDHAARATAARIRSQQRSN